MSKIEELIEKLCPNGVKFEKIENLTNFEQPTKYIVKSTKYNEEYAIPVLTAGQSFILGYTNEQNGIYNASKEKPVIIFDDFTGAFKWVDFPFKVKSSAIKIITAKNNKTTIRYLYHMMGFLKFCSNEHKRLWISAYSQFKVAVPPLEVQCEIVHILDDFTLLSAELSAELKARQKQYEFYRKELLNNKNTKLYQLKDIIKKSCSGGTPLKSKLDYYQNGTIPWLRTQDVRFNEIYEATSFITEIAVQETSAKWIPENCVIVAISGASAGRCAINKFRTTTNQHCLNIEIDNSKALYKYVFYCVCSKYDELISMKQGARGDLNASKILSLKIPMPSIDEQEKIVNVLERFDKLCNDISEGLPAEIEARQKQYEYYRDKLLTFKELKVNE